jgi:hypothetical protein
LSVTDAPHWGMLDTLTCTFFGMSKSADQPWIGVDPDVGDVDARVVAGAPVGRLDEIEPRRPAERADAQCDRLVLHPTLPTCPPGPLHAAITHTNDNIPVLHIFMALLSLFSPTRKRSLTRTRRREIIRRRNENERRQGRHFPDATKEVPLP